MNGAQALIRTLVDAGVTACFSNPGTSEMHFVAALDSVPEMRAVLALFEGVATGAADGYARMSGRPAAVLLHLGPGLGNGLANLHNARRARVPLVNIVGDHATYHKRFDAQLESDIDSVARTVSGWTRRSARAEDAGDDAADAVAASSALPGQVAPLSLPAALAELAAGRLDGIAHLVLVDAKPPVSFFAYPDKPSYLVPDGCDVSTLVDGHQDVAAALDALADAVDAGANSIAVQGAVRPQRPTGALTAEAVGQALGAVLPEGAIVSDEANTSGVFVNGPTAGAPPHDWLTLTGGAIGQ